MAIIDELRSAFMGVLETTDFSSAFPGGYSGAKGVLVIPGWPYDVIDNMQASTNGQMTKPIIAVVPIDTIEADRTLGDQFGPGAGGTTQYAIRIEVPLLVGCWADQYVGGEDMTEKLAGIVLSTFFINRTVGAAFRHARATSTHQAYMDRPQLWRADVTVRGDALITYSA